MKPADTSDPMPHEMAPLWVWHMWLCHGSDATGHDCETLHDDACDAPAEPHRLKRYLSLPGHTSRVMSKELRR